MKSLTRPIVSGPIVPPKQYPRSSNSPKKTRSPQETVPSQSEDKVFIETAGKAAGHIVRAIPGAINVAFQSPKLIVAPVLNAIDPATTNHTAIAHESWSDIIGAALVGGVVGATLALLNGGISALPAIGLGALLGGSAGTMGAVQRSLFGEKVTEGTHWLNKRTSAKALYPEIGEAAVRASQSSETRSYGAGKALIAGYKAGISEAYERGASVGDSVLNFTRGVFGTTEG